MKTLKLLISLAVMWPGIGLSQTLQRIDAADSMLHLAPQVDYELELLGYYDQQPPRQLQNAIHLSNSSAFAQAMERCHSCAITAKRELKCWGSNWAGQLGMPPNQSPDTCSGEPCATTPVSIGLPGEVLDMAGGYWHNIAVLDNGDVYAWGYGAKGQLGQNSTADSYTPVKVALPGPAVQVACGDLTSYARLANGEVYAWGFNHAGQLGNGSTTDALLPVKVPISDVVYLSARFRQAAVVKSDSTMWMWGENFGGQLGVGTLAGPDICGGLACATTPVQVHNLAQVRYSVSGDHHTCAVLHDGRMYCWGRDNEGQAGNGPGDIRDSLPRQIMSSDLAEYADAGDLHTCMIVKGSPGEMKCWGRAFQGQLGNNNDKQNQHEPVAVIGLSDVRHFAAGGLHNCAVLADGAVRCWGFNARGQLGNGQGQDGLESHVPYDHVLGFPGIAWTSTNPAVATVDSSGRLRTHQHGSALIIVRVKTHTDTLRLVVDSSLSSVPHRTRAVQQLWPNPVQHALHLSFHDAQARTLKLYDLQGEAVMHVDMFEKFAELDMAGLAAGLYLLHVQQGEFVDVRKVIKR